MRFTYFVPCLTLVALLLAFAGLVTAQNASLPLPNVAAVSVLVSAAIQPLSVRPVDAAKMLGISTRTLYSITSPRGTLPVVRLPGGRSLLYRLSDLERWLASHASTDVAGKGGRADAE
jgi:predicted DNA-binding transcriptional regulator AlpA